MERDDECMLDFRKRGVVAGIRVKSASEAEMLQSMWNALEAEEGFQTGAYSTTHSRHLDCRFVWELVSSPTILDHVEKLIGPDILLFGSRFFCKYGPDAKYRVSWHQDIDSWGLEPPVAVTVWYAVDRSDMQNGCMQVIPGSHRTAALREHETSPDEGNILGRRQHLDIGTGELMLAQPIVLDAGEISIHDGALIHASMPNTSDRRRCGLAIRYVPCHVRQRPELAKSPPSKAILVRGTDKYKNFGASCRPFAQ